jgi:hypothetical protein
LVCAGFYSPYRQHAVIESLIPFLIDGDMLDEEITMPAANVEDDEEITCKPNGLLSVARWAMHPRQHSCYKCGQQTLKVHTS